MAEKPNKGPKPPGLASLLKPYKGWMALLVLLTVASSGLGLAVPQVIARAIDAFTSGHLDLTSSLIVLTALSLGTFVLGNLQSVVQTMASEQVARDLRTRLAGVVSLQTYASVEAMTPAKLLTNLTSDVNAIKTFVAQAIASLISSVFLIIGASILLLLINWKLALAVLAVLPIVGITFYLVLRRVRQLFTRSQEAIDWLNKVINESVLGSALIRLLNSQQSEYEKFLDANDNAKTISMSILRLFAALIPDR